MENTSPNQSTNAVQSDHSAQSQPSSPVFTVNRTRRRSSLLATQKGPLSGQIALVTGATGGIGSAVCRLLAAHGCSVGIHFKDDQETANDLVEELKESWMGVFGSKFVTVRADLGGAEQGWDEVKELHEHISHYLGPPTILINNSGTTSGHAGVSSIDQIPISVFEETWRVNCGAAYLLSQLCLPAMEGEGWGRIIFVSSVAGFTGGAVGPHYASSKAALHGLIHWLAMAYAKKGITINGVAPALIEDTKMLADLPGTDEERASKIPVGRLGSPDEVAETVLWMVKTGYVTNKVIGVDGGMFPQ